MYVVTFYSFKGGVGRTMALVNSAYELMQRGRRVLIIDFDLEAPGISTYPTLSAAAERPGIVDYVTQYLQSGLAPDVADYIVECPSEAGTISVMPAGKRNAEYGAKLHAIDWQELYAEHQGFLMFEDLKQQLAQLKPSYDYVLIDSRTGHTDVRGICTRQLPNAVVLLFLPNEDNITGLSGVVREIRNDKARKQEISILFCPSNVPDLDDEEEILKRLLKKARSTLRYKQAASMIRHYNSLKLLEQEVFVVDRPKTRLAEEYRTLVTTVMKYNVEDREGALARLEEWSGQIRTRDTVSRVLAQDVMNGVSDVISRHKGDGEVAMEAAWIYEALGAKQKESEALTIAINQGYQATEALYRRAQSHAVMGEIEAAIPDLRRVIASRDVAPHLLAASVEMLRPIYKEWLAETRSAPALKLYSPEDRLLILAYLTTDREVLDDVVDAAYEAIRSRNTRGGNADNLLTLSLIGSGRFEEAMRWLATSRRDVTATHEIRVVFNYAMAEWGVRQISPTDLLLRVVDLHRSNLSPRDDPNYHMCIALVHAALGNIGATREWTAKARHSVPAYVFSSWRYLQVSRADFLKDLEAVEKFASGGRAAPFLSVKPRQGARTPTRH